MGPLADLKMGQENDSEKKQAIRWLDNNENDKGKLVTNKSDDDLIYKEQVELVKTHKRSASTKATIKPFSLSIAKVTGVHHMGSGRALLKTGEK